MNAHDTYLVIHSPLEIAVRCALVGIVQLIPAGLVNGLTRKFGVKAGIIAGFFWLGILIAWLGWTYHPAFQFYQTLPAEMPDGKIIMFIALNSLTLLTLSLAAIAVAIALGAKAKKPKS